MYSIDNQKKRDSNQATMHSSVIMKGILLGTRAIGSFRTYKLVHVQVIYNYAARSTDLAAVA